MIAAFVTGNLGKDATLRTTAGGDSVLGFSVASNAKVKGEKTTTWVDCSLCGKRAEALAQYLTRGTRVAVSGELGTREYEGKTYITLRVNELDLMGGGERRQQQTDSRPSQSNQGPDDNFPDAF